MSWFPERQQRTWLQQICEGILKTGPLPKHVAFIMDGNRRFAKKQSMESCQGHLKGFDKLAETLDWCLDLGVCEVTVYAFSIENFKRPKEEVDYLMELARQKFARLMQEKDLIQKHGVCIRVIGNIGLLPADVQQHIAEAVNFSKHNDRAILNVCFAYTAQDDICNAMKELAQGVRAGDILESDISESLLENCLYTAQSRPVDLLIRTSGEVRLSDFLLWESTYSCLAFVKVLWPEFSIWHLYGTILHYQRNHSQIQIARQSRDIEREHQQRDSDHRQVTRELASAAPEENASGDSLSLHGRVQIYAESRRQRTEHFLHNLYARRNEFLEKIQPVRMTS
ncbi:dehydrodolichyl diphosphate synthase complex subunit DHDDS-like [Babylonia areolata]|uniref:dehydrodolichyl diphosphate synthase complex subunit DHDDS-like n=1 Tax=Babylonia areolata TaxID=304850 RepID=UPI003FD489E2